MTEGRRARGGRGVANAPNHAFPLQHGHGGDGHAGLGQPPTGCAFMPWQA